MEFIRSEEEVHPTEVPIISPRRSPRIKEKRERVEEALVEEKKSKKKSSLLNSTQSCSCQTPKRTSSSTSSTSGSIGSLDVKQGKYKKPHLEEEEEEVLETVYCDSKVKKGKHKKQQLDITETKNEADNTPVRKKRRLALESEVNPSANRKRKVRGRVALISTRITEEDQCLKVEEATSSQEKKGKGKSKKGRLADQGSCKRDEGVISKGKGKRAKLKEKLKGRKQEVVHKSVIRFNMSSKSGKDGDQQPGPSNEGQPKYTTTDQATGSSTTGGDNPPDPMDPFMALMNDETKRLQMMLEARGLPPHLLGSLGPRMPHLFSKHMSSSNNSKAQQLLDGLKCIDDESIQLQSCIEIGQLLVMGNEDTLSGFPVKDTVPALMLLLSMEHNFDMMMNASRALTYMMEALPRSTVVVANAIPLLLEKLQSIQCMDVAEQALSALEILSKKHSKSILQSGGVNACLLYLDFFSLTTQRSALSVAANCCLSVSEDDYYLVKDSIPLLSTRLHHQDKKSVENCCLCFSRLIESFVGHPEILKQVASQGLLSNIQTLLVMSPAVISTNMFVIVVKMMSTLSSVCPVLAIELLQLNIAETLKYLLVGSEDMTTEGNEMHSRSSNEVYEIVSLISELLPPLPNDGIFEVDKLLVSSSKRPLRVMVQWEWQSDSESWIPYKRSDNRILEAAHMSGEDEVSIDLSGRTYVIDFGAMQQFNEDTGNARTVRRNIIDTSISKEESPKSVKKMAEEDPRQLTLCAEPELCANFMQLLLGVLFEEFNNMAAPSVKHRCLKAILRMLNTALPDILTDVLRDLSVSSYIATMLQVNDYRIVVGAIQMANILINKLPEIFLVYFHREGVMHLMETLKNLPLKAINTPKKAVQPSSQQPSLSFPITNTPLYTNSSIVPVPLPHPSSSFALSMPHPGVPPPINTSPPGGATVITSESPSTARRFADIFRRSRRQLRKSFSKSRSEDTTVTPPMPPSQQPLLSMPVIHMPSLVITSSGTTSSHVPSPAALFQSVAMETRNEREEPVPSINNEDEKTVKEKIHDWIKTQAITFLEKWSIDTNTDENPALDVMKKLQKTTERLHPSSPDCLDAIKELYDILTNSVTSVSAFELIHCRIPHVLDTVLSDESPTLMVPLTVRLKHFSSVFMGLPEKDSELSSWIPQERPGLLILLSRLHRCINQIENFPVKVYDTQGRRGPQAMRFFNTHQIKVLLTLHPTASGLRNFKGATVRIDPLATMQAIERYLIIKGVTSTEQKSSDETEGSEESDSDEAGMLTNIPIGTAKRQLEFLINGNIVPHNMTVFQAVKMYAIASEDSEEDLNAIGTPDVWIQTHMIHYRLIGQGLKPKRSYSVPTTPISDPLLTRPKYTHSISIGSSSANKVKYSNSSPSNPLDMSTFSEMRITRSMSRDKHQKNMSSNKTAGEEETEEHSSLSSYKLSPLLQGIRKLKMNKYSTEDPSLSIISLVGILHILNSHWNDLYHGFPGNAVVSISEFVNVKLTSKASRQLQDPLNVMTGNFPNWLKELAKQSPFLFMFEYRQTFFYLTAFDRDRAIMRLQEQQPDMSSSESNERITPKLEKKKRCVSRDGLLHQAERIMEDVGTSKALLEIQYEEEVGTGLGPTLEFYTLVSREVQQANLQMWRGDPCPLPGSSSSSQASNISAGVTQYIHSPVGLFPAPLAADTSFSIVEEICSRFRFLGCFMAKAIMDSRMLDLPLSEAFYTWMLEQEHSFTAQDLQHVDPVLSRSFAQLADVAVRKHQLECDPLLSGKALQVGIESLTLDGGGSIDDLYLDFTLPGYPYIELKPHGKEIPVNIHNLDEYLKLVVDWTLMKGVKRQMKAFRDGFNKVFPITTLQQFYPHEMDILLCGANNQKWDIKELVDNCRPDHGYTHDSQTVQFLFQVLSSYNTTEQRQFIQFVTGCPRLPVGGFKALNPPLTIVRKTSEGQNPDKFLPSVMTCVNYLKLPDYSSKEIMKQRLDIALQEGKHSFHLS